MTATTVYRLVATPPSEQGASAHRCAAEKLVRSVMVERWGCRVGRRLPVWPPLCATEKQLIEFWADPEMEV